MRTERERFFCVVNPVAGRGRTRRLWPLLEKLIRSHGLKYERCFTEAPGEAQALAARAAREGFSRVVAVGGDGTAHQVANGLLGAEAALGVLPTGGGNDFAKAIGVPLQLAEAVAALAGGVRRLVDVGLIEGRCFVNGLGIGLDGAVSHRYRRMRRLRGELGYLWGAVYEALTFRRFEVELVTPDWCERTPALLVGATNGQYQGGDFWLSPEACVDDSLLDVYLFRDMPSLKRLVQIPRVRRGAHLGIPEFESRRAPWVQFTLNRPIPAHVDGEPFHLGPGRVQVELAPRALAVIAAVPPG